MYKEQIGQFEHLLQEISKYCVQQQSKTSVLWVLLAGLAQQQDSHCDGYHPECFKHALRSKQPMCLGETHRALQRTNLLQQECPGHVFPIYITSVLPSRRYGLPQLLADTGVCDSAEAPAGQEATEITRKGA